MVTATYRKVLSTVENVKQHFVSYLNKAGYSRDYSLDQLQRFQNPSYLEHPHNPGRYIVAKGGSFKNQALNLQQIGNVLTTIYQLNELLEASSELNETDLTKILDDVKAILDKGLQTNIQLSESYAKDHHSATQNKASGLGFFSGLWNKIGFESRATRAFEAAMTQVDEIKNNHSLTS
ncbi:MAG: hypothetical protein ACHP65_04130 [Legionellales bacterium]